MSINAAIRKSGGPRPDWAAAIVDELDEVERRLNAAVLSEVDAAQDISLHLLNAGGKRIRPALVILSALSVNGGRASTAVLNLAAVVELVHMASLIHDDVIDETRERRGRETANARWGNKLSVLGGDYLLARAFSMLAANADQDVIRLLASTAVRMTESELLQARSEGSVEMWQQNYLRIIRDKTANFMSACCEAGALAAGADTVDRLVLAEYGENLGLAFQIADDVLDVTGDPEAMGKAVGTDISRGKFTLPIILALERLEDRERNQLTEALDTGSKSPESVRDVASLVVGCGAVDEAMKTAVHYANRAADLLGNLPDSEYRASLMELSRYVVSRNS